MGAPLLIVRHGAGRGRSGPFLDQILDLLSDSDPALRAAIACHATGDPAPSLDGVSTVLFWLADPLRERYPACFAEAAAIEARAHAAGLRVENAPEALSNSIKSTQARIWNDAGAPTPAHDRFDSVEALLADADRLTYPAMVKADQYHGQKMGLFHSAGELRRAIAPRSLFGFRRRPTLKPKGPISVCAYVDVRAGYAATRPDALRATHFHKKRSIVLGDIVHPRHIIFSLDPIVSMASSTLAPYRPDAAGSGQSAVLDDVTRFSVEEDNRYCFSPPEQPDLLRRACRALGFATAAVDYSELADGQIVLWEANPYFFLYSPETYVLPDQRRLQERRSRLLEDTKAFLGGLIPNEASGR